MSPFRSTHALVRLASRPTVIVYIGLLIIVVMLIRMVFLDVDRLIAFSKIKEDRAKELVIELGVDFSMPGVQEMNFIEWPLEYDTRYKVFLQLNGEISPDVNCLHQLQGMIAFLALDDVLLHSIDFKSPKRLKTTVVGDAFLLANGYCDDKFPRELRMNIIIRSSDPELKQTSHKLSILRYFDKSFTASFVLLKIRIVGLCALCALIASGVYLYLRCVRVN